MVKRRIMRKSSAVDSLLYLSRNVEIVRKQMLQIDDMFKQLIDARKESSNSRSSSARSSRKDRATMKN